jgi:hypothetical protein
MTWIEVFYILLLIPLSAAVAIGALMMLARFR